jgi:hypothetical protein
MTFDQLLQQAPSARFQGVTRRGRHFIFGEAFEAVVRWWVLDTRLFPQSCASNEMRQSGGESWMQGHGCRSDEFCAKIHQISITTHNIGNASGHLCCVGWLPWCSGVLWSHA